MSNSKVFEGVCNCVAVVLDLPAEEITLESRLMEDLGADSLDLLDLTFHLEQTFKVKISPRDIERRTRETLDGKPLETNGVYTPEAVAEFRRSMPEVPLGELPDGMPVAALPRTFRVETMVNMISRLLEADA